MTDWTADPLVWGHGPCEFEAFLEPTCPHSARAFPKLFGLLDRAGPERMTLRITLQSQPWHLFSGFVTRAIIAASTLPDGREAARTAMAGIYARREEFVFENHSRGPNLDCTPRQLIARIEEASGLALAEAFQHDGLDRETKRHARYARQNGIHATPSFTVDRLVRSDFGSRDTVETWATAMGLAI
jgi:protein-disulfide isomerase